MEEKKKLVSRILKELERFVLVLSFISGILLIGWLHCYWGSLCHGCSREAVCFSYLLKVLEVSFVIIPLILIFFICLKKISKMWLIDTIISFLLLFCTGQVIDYMTREEPKQSSIEERGTLWEKQGYEREK